jgi:hypothetical protein
MKMQQAHVFLSGENLWSWSPLYKRTRDLDIAGINGSDQDLHKDSNYGDGWNYPLLKSISFGLSVTF